jgi:hypothetical protein
MAKKSMIEREKKRIKLHKYALKRASLLKRIKAEENFNIKLELHSKYNNYLVTARKREFETDVGKLVDPVVSSEILDYHVMFSVKWHTNVYYQV